jgi:hypothetical protein
MKFPPIPGKTPREQFENLARMMFAAPKADIEGKKRAKKRCKAAAVAGIVAVFLLLSACTAMMPYRGYGDWTDDVQMLGPVSYCQGGFCSGTEEGSQWPLGLTNPPSQDSIHAALITKAARKYNVRESEVVLRDVNVKLSTEMVGTVRGWYATATAGRMAHK